MVKGIFKIELETESGKKFYLKGKTDKLKENGIISVLDYKTNVEDKPFINNEDIIEKSKLTPCS